MDRDQFQYLKDHDLAFKQPAEYERIHMPKNTWAGIVIAVLSGIMGFAMVWHIWWLAIVSTVAMIGAFIVYNFQRSKDYYVEVEEIERIENSYYEQLNQLKNEEAGGDQPEVSKPGHSLSITA